MEDETNSKQRVPSWSNKEFMQKLKELEQLIEEARQTAERSKKIIEEMIHATQTNSH